MNIGDRLDPKTLLKKGDQIKHDSGVEIYTVTQDQTDPGVIDLSWQTKNDPKDKVQTTHEAVWKGMCTYYTLVGREKWRRMTKEDVGNAYEGMKIMYLGQEYALEKHSKEYGGWLFENGRRVVNKDNVDVCPFEVLDNTPVPAPPVQTGWRKMVEADRAIIKPGMKVRWTEKNKEYFVGPMYEEKGKHYILVNAGDAPRGDLYLNVIGNSWEILIEGKEPCGHCLDYMEEGTCTVCGCTLDDLCARIG